MSDSEIPDTFRMLAFDMPDPNEDEQTRNKPKPEFNRFLAWVVEALFWLVAALAYAMLVLATPWQWNENSRFSACLLLGIAVGALAHWLVPDRFLAWLVFASAAGIGVVSGIIWERRR
jgi:membrane protein YdbS with pleckstrin-like domain